MLMLLTDNCFVDILAVHLDNYVFVIEWSVVFVLLQFDVRRGL